MASPGSLVLPSMDGHSCDAETLYVLYGLVRYLKPALIVEAGTYMGHATATMALALREGLVDGEVWTADVCDYGATKVMEENGLSDRVHFFNGDFNAMLDGPLAGRNARFAFIDSGLTVNSDVKVPTNIRFSHYQKVAARMQRGGVIVIDDMATDGFVDAAEIRKTAGVLMEYGRGLALVQR